MMIERKKNMELHLSVLKERKNIFPARQRGAVMAFIPDLTLQLLMTPELVLEK